MAVSNSNKAKQLSPLNPETMAPLLRRCVLRVRTGLLGWQKTMTKIFQDIQGLTINIKVDGHLDGEVHLALMYLQGEVDPIIFIKKLYQARCYAFLCRMDYGYEENPEEARKPNNHYMASRFLLNILEEGWDKRIIGALKPTQGVSFSIEALQDGSHMVDLRGNIEIGVLMRTVAKMGIHLLTLEYGVGYKVSNMKPPAKILEAPPPANETETQPEKDTVPTRPEDVSTSTKHQVVYKKRSCFRMFC